MLLTFVLIVQTATSSDVYWLNFPFLLNFSLVHLGEKWLETVTQTLVKPFDMGTDLDLGVLLRLVGARNLMLNLYGLESLWSGA